MTRQINTWAPLTNGNQSAPQIRLDKVRLDKDSIYISFKKLINPNSKLTDKAKIKIKARLKTYSEQELVKAMENFSKDSWWMEHNSNRGVAWFLHTDERIDGLINLKPKEKLINKLE